ncbi:MAG: hypothetical protein ACREID_09700 [Planctomycetota bacterium]
MPPRKVAGIGDEAVEAKTGRDWAEWCAIFDKWGAEGKGHAETARHLHEKHGVSGWWLQTVTVGCEQERGLREKHETAEGFQASTSRTMDVPLARLYAAWADAKPRARWFGRHRLTIRRATEGKSMRITWGDGATSLDVGFLAKGKGKGKRKSQIAVHHRKLASARGRRAMSRAGC